MNKPKLSAMDRDRRRTGYLLLLPSAVLIAVFVLYPLFRVVFLSFTDWNGIRTHVKFVGLKNYKFLVEMNRIGVMVLATLFYVACDTIFKNVLSFILALSLDKKGKGRMNRNLFRTAWYLPALLSGASAGVGWHIMLIYRGGVINAILGWFGIAPINWLETFGLVNIGIVMAAVWMGIGSTTIIYLAGLQGISQDLYEAAYLDGASPRQITRHITLPMMAPAITINVVTTSIAAFKAYEMPEIIGTGPNDCAKLITSKIMSFTAGLDYYASSCALSVLLILVIVLLSLVQLYFLQRNEEKNG